MRRHLDTNITWADRFRHLLGICPGVEVTRRLSPGEVNKAGLSISISRQCIDIIDIMGDYFAFVRCTVAIYAPFRIFRILSEERPSDIDRVAGLGCKTLTRGLVMISAAINRQYQAPSSADSPATSPPTDATATWPCSTCNSDTVPARTTLSGRVAQERPRSCPSDPLQAKHRIEGTP